MLPEIITPIPGPRSRALAQELRRHECRNTTFISPHFPIFWERAHGVNVWDVDGNRFLDLTSGFGVSGLGYTPPSVVEAGRDQLGKLYHAMGDVHPTAEKATLCQKLSSLTFERWGLGPGKVLLGNSGGDAVEAALKTARLATGKRGVLAFEGGYHGLGYGPLTVTKRADFQRPFTDQLSNFASFAPFPSDIRNGHSSDHEERREVQEKRLRQLLETGEIGAILVEPIQGRGGEIIPPDWFLPLLRRLADEYGALLIFDEIYTGFFRTGRWFACEHTEARPDLICLGKALTSGFPLSACVGRATVMDAWPESTGEALHTSTFLGNPLGCRMALAALTTMEQSVETFEVTTRGSYLLKILERLASNLQCYRHPRGRGLLAGLEVVDHEGNPAATFTGQLIENSLARGLILLGGGLEGNVLSFTPPFMISEAEIDFVGSILASIVA